MSQIRTVIISLARSHARREAITARLRELGMSFEVATGIDGQALTQEDLASYSPGSAFTVLGREMHRNEVGCFMSHAAIWKSLAEGDEKEVLIFEDDMRIDDDFPALIRSRDWIPGDAGIVNFSWDMASPIDVRKLPGGRSLCRFDGDVMRLGAYILRKHAARNLLTNAFPIRMPIDSLAGRPEFVGAPIYGVSPRPVKWDDDLPSETWTDSTREAFAAASRNTPRGLLYRLLGRLRK
jgi:glycosyl transferase, family 25